ncbi:MAG: hypothetical protein ABW169_11005 [Sphingobium sp.]
MHEMRAPQPASDVIMTPALEMMSPTFTKWHLGNGAAIHRFTGTDTEFHDHPWGFSSTILAGGYTEEVIVRSDDGRHHIERYDRVPGETFRIEARHIHRIVHLRDGACWTLVQADNAGVHIRQTRFWRFTPAGLQSRLWSEGWAQCRSSALTPPPVRALFMR